MSFRSTFLPSSRLALALLALTALRLVFAGQIDFIEDEAYYRLWGLYPAFAYFDHAPMVGWWIAIGHWIFGDTHLGLRVMSPVASLLGSLILWRSACLVSDRAHADLAVLIFNAMVLMGVGSVLMTPDVPSVFFWGLALWTMLEWQKSGQRMWWIAFGVAAGFGLLSKYTNGFLGIGIVVWLVASGRWRDAVRAPHFWLAGLIAGLMFTPVLAWNAQHDFISFTRQFGRLQSHGFTLRYLGEWLGGQALLISPLIFLFFGVALFKLRRITQDRNSPTALVVITALPLLAYFVSHVFTSRINANWTAPIFPNIALLTAPVLATAMADSRSVWRKLARWSVPTGLIMSLLVLVEAWHPLLPPDARNPISQIRGYQSFAADVFEQQRVTNATAIVTSRYQLTSLLDYELRGQSQIVQLTERIRFLNQPASRSVLPNGAVLYVARDSEAKSFIDQYRTCFAKADFIRMLERRDRETVIETYQLWRLEGLNPHLLDRGIAIDCR